MQNNYVMLGTAPLRFLAKARSYEDLCDLMEKRYPQEAISICPVDTWSQPYSHAQLEAMYLLSAGDPWVGEAFNKVTLVGALNQLLARIAFRKAIPREIPVVPAQGEAEPAKVVGRPATTSKTGQVWQKADFLYGQLTAEVEWKSFRGLLIASCEEAGINKATASTQYAKWKSAREVI